MAQMPLQGSKREGLVFYSLTLADITNQSHTSFQLRLDVASPVLLSSCSRQPPAWPLELASKWVSSPQRSKGYGWAGYRRFPEGRGLHLGLERGIWIVERKGEVLQVAGAV